MMVSIIIPVYNVAAYIEDCLRSVMSQIYTGSMECLLINDSCTDDSMNIAEQMIAKYEGAIRFKILHHEQNRGLSAARNIGIDNSAGDYLYFLDSDDVITENCIALLMEKVEENPEVEMVQGNVKTSPIRNLDGLTVKVKIHEALTNEEVRKCFFQTRQLNGPAWNKLIKRSFVIENKIRFIEGVIYEDTPWTFHLLKYLKHVCFAADETYQYRRRERSIVTGANNKAKAESFRIIYQHILANLTPRHEHEELSFYGKKFAYFYSRYLRYEPDFGKDLPCWQDKARTYNCIGISMRLTASKFLAKIKKGWLVLSLVYRIEHPSVIPTDFQRVCYSI